MPTAAASRRAFVMYWRSRSKSHCTLLTAAQSWRNWMTPRSFLRSVPWPAASRGGTPPSDRSGWCGHLSSK